MAPFPYALASSIKRGDIICILHRHHNCYTCESMKEKKQILLRVLLSAIMVLQPVVGAYAMAGMDHYQGDVASNTMFDHEMGHAMNKDARAGSQEDCCTSNAVCLMSACNAELFMASIAILNIDIIFSISTYQFSWADILLPAEIRPPRQSFPG